MARNKQCQVSVPSTTILQWQPMTFDKRRSFASGPLCSNRYTLHWKFGALRAPPSSSCGGHWGALRALIGGPSGPHHLTTTPPPHHHPPPPHHHPTTSWKKLTKIVKNRFFKMLFVTTSQNINQNPEPFLESSFLKVF